MKTALGFGDFDADGPLGALSEVAAARQQLARREAVEIRRARSAGMSWAEIGLVLGVSKQALHKKYGKRS